MRSKSLVTDTPFYIAAVGASAGGLDALEKMFQGIDDYTADIAFIIAQHQGVSYKSNLIDLFGRFTGMTVMEARNAQQLKPGVVYITPQGREVEIKGKTFSLSSVKHGTAARPSIDHLMISLAKSCGSTAMGIILSGTGSDGAAGIAAIKEAGGTTMVQEPATAIYSGMPQSSIDTGRVDFILPPGKIGRQINVLLKRGVVSAVTADVTEKHPRRIIDALTRISGTDFSNYKYNTLARRIAKRMEVLSMKTVPKYLAYLESQGQEPAGLLKSILIGVTAFFRDADVFRALDKILLDILRGKTANDPVRIWIAGCSTGEEAYSVAISLAILMQKKSMKNKVQIFATDINEDALHIARKAVYGKKELQHLAPDILHQYFTPQHEAYEIVKSVRSMVLFSRHDLTVNPPFIKLDLVVCRNLLIYFNERLQEHILPVLYSALQPGGYLLLGKSESVGKFSNLFSVVNQSAKIYRRKSNSLLSRITYSPFQQSKKTTITEKPAESITDLIKDTLYQNFESPWVVVNDSMEIQEIHGDVSEFLGLKPGQMNSHLVKLAHKEIKTELRSLLQKSITSKTEIRGAARRIESLAHPRYVRITVCPLLAAGKQSELFLVVFGEAMISMPVPASLTVQNNSKTDNQRIQDLEKELDTVKEELQTFLERLQNSNADLKSANEEWQSANEELKISNEELETTNEELQSANEELTIAYAELKAASETLEVQDNVLRRTETNMLALLNNTLQAFILLDAEGRVLAYNNVAKLYIKKIYGKKIEKGLGYLQLIDERVMPGFKKAVLQGLKGKQVMIQLNYFPPKNNGESFMVNCTPVLDAYRRTQTLSVSLLDITEMQRIRAELSRSAELLNSIFHTADIGIAMVNEKGRYVQANDGYCRLFGYSQAGLVGKPYTITVPADQRKNYGIVLAGMFSGEYEQNERTAVKKNGSRLTVFRTVNVFIAASGEKFLVLTARDTTETSKLRNLLQQTEKTARIGGWEMESKSGLLSGTDEFFQITGLPLPSSRKIPLSRFRKRIAGREYAAALLQQVKTAAVKGRPFAMYFPLNSETDKQQWIQLHCTVNEKKDGKFRLTGTIQDVTEKRASEEEIERLSVVASRTNNAVFITDAAGKTVWVNESAERMTGYKKQAFLNMTPGAVLQGPDTQQAMVRRMRSMIKKKLPVNVLIKNYKQSGKSFWMNMDIAPVFRNKMLVNFIGVGTDVTEILEAKEAQKQNELQQKQQKLFGLVAQYFPDGIIGVLDSKLQYVYAGGAEIKKLGLTRENLIGSNIFDHLSLHGNRDALPYLKRALNGENIDFETIIKEQVYSVNAVPLFEHGSGGAHILIVITNITRRRRVETDLHENLVRQQELNDLKTKFVTIASHEFRTPLSGILSSSYLISKYNELHQPDKIEKHAASIAGAVHTLSFILNDFLSVGKIEEGKVVNNPVRFNVVEFCSEITEEMKQVAKKNQAVYYQHEGREVEMVLDKQHLRNVLVNLLSNAIKYSAEGDSIWFSSLITADKWIFSIKDEGIGIPSEDKPKLFQTFFRANNTGNYQGTGMGLHIVSRFLELMNGHIELESHLNQGSIFTVSFFRPSNTASLNGVLPVSNHTNRDNQRG